MLPDFRTEASVKGQGVRRNEVYPGGLLAAEHVLLRQEAGWVGMSFYG